MQHCSMLWQTRGMVQSPLLLHPHALVPLPAAPCSPRQPPQEQRGAVLALPGNDQISWWPKYNYQSWLGAAPFQAS